MAIESWLPKVILILTCCRISCAHFDDLLDRVRLSKSNDPEVRDFLKSVLKHHEDFRWIQGEVAKIHRDDHMLPLRGLPLKSKRAFQSSRDGYPILRSYGYRTPHNLYKNNVDLNGPVNDVYPYEEDSHYNPTERSISALHNMENKRSAYDDKLNYDDFLEDEEPDASFVDDYAHDARSKRSLTDYVDEDQHQVPNLKRSSDAEKLLNEKLMLRNILYNKKLGSKYRNTVKEPLEKSKYINFLGDSNLDSIEVLPNSEKGVLYAPGNKYEFKTDVNKKKRECAENYEDHELKMLELFGKKGNESIETPLGEFYYSGPHDILGINQDIQMEQHDNNISCVKYKKRLARGIHLDEILSPVKRARKQDKSIKIKIFDDGRLVKNIQKGDTTNSIVLTINNDKNIHNKLNSVGDAINSLNQYTDSPLKPLSDLNSYSNIISSNNMYRNLRGDNTLQKIDTIIKHDQATLKLNSQLPGPPKLKKESLDDLEHNDKALFALYEESGAQGNSTAVKRKSVTPNYLHPEREAVSFLPKKEQSLKKVTKKLTYQRVNEMGTHLQDRNPDGGKDKVHSDGNEEDVSYKTKRPTKTSKQTEMDDNVEDNKNNRATKKGYSNKIWSPLKKKYTKKINEDSTPEDDLESIDQEMIVTPSQEKQNRLEDQTEPTSAAEQRELGKINNNFNTLPADFITTEKMLIIPFKKNSDNSDLENSEIESELRKIKFHVKDTRDMIHNKKNKKSQGSTRIMVDNKLKESDEVLGKLKSDLEKAIKVDYNSKNQIQPIVEESATASNMFDENVKEGGINLQKNEFDDLQISDKNGLRKIDNDVEAIRKTDGDTAYDNDDEEELDSDLFQSRKLNSVKSTENYVDEDYLTLEEKVFQSRKLLGTDYIKKYINNKNVYTKPRIMRTKKSLKDLFGMTNDEDYSEDKIDYYDDHLQQKRSEDNDEDDFGTVTKFKPNVHPANKVHKLVGRKGTRKVYKSSPMRHKIEKNKRFEEAKKGKTSKVVQMKKKDVSEELKSEAKVNMFTNRVDLLQKRDSGLPTLKKDNIFKLSDGLEDNALPPEENGNGENQAQGGNELDIIEKTQAILLHITNPPLGNLSSKGEYDDNDDTSAKLNEPGGLAVKRLNTYKVTDHVENEDVVNEILKIVNNYKEKEKKKHHTNKNNNNEEDTRINRYLNYNDDEDASFSHHLHKDKKAHPSAVNLNNCKVKPGVDHYYKGYHPKHSEGELEYAIPKPAKEGYLSEDTMLESKSSKDNSDNPVDTEVEDFTYKRTQRNQLGDNPMQFTPDNVESFKEIVENPRDRMDRKSEFNIELRPNLEESDDFEARFKRYLRKQYKNMRSKKYSRRSKRNLEDNADDLEFDALISPLHRQDESNEDPAIRKRRFKNYYYDPYYFESYPRFRQQASTGPPPAQAIEKVTMPSASLSTGLPNVTQASSILFPTILQAAHTCHTEEPVRKIAENLEQNKKCLDSSSKKNKPKFTKFKGRGKSGDFGVVYDIRNNKEETERDHKIREKNREKMKFDKAQERQREHEHMKNLLNGRMVLEIMETFQTRLKDNENLYSKFGQGIGRKCAQDQVALIDAFRDEQSKQDIKHAQLMLHQVIVMMNKIVADQVHRRTCLVLPPMLHDFLKRIATVRESEKSIKVAEGYPLPQIKVKTLNHGSRSDERQADFLFPNPEGEAEKINSNINMEKKINLIRKLLAKYNHMSENCQIKVEPVKDYLVQHLAMLEKLYKEKKTEPEDTCTVNPAYLTKCDNNTTTVTTPPIQPSVNGTNTTLSSEATTPSVSPVPATPAGIHPTRAAKQSGLNFRDYKLDNRHAKALSEKYKKLVEAADTYRRKRQIEERLARLFGRHKENNNNNKAKNKEELDDISQVAFESPIVYSLDE